MRVLVLADDLTGAGDTVVSFARSGWLSLLSLSGGWRHEPEEDAVAVTLDSRRDPRAERVTARAVGDLDPELLYVKIDSTVRGRVAEQVRGAVAGRRRSRPAAYAVLCPAYPAMGRTVEDGHVLVHGAPVHHGAAGEDPVTPVTESDLRVLVPGAVLVDGEDLTAAIREAGERGEVVVVDARDQADLDRIAAAVAEIGPDAVPVGSAGLAVALARVWRTSEPSRPSRVEVPADSRSLVLVSSLHPVAREQVAELKARAEQLGVDLLVTDPARIDGAAEQRARDLGAEAAAALSGGEGLPAYGLLVLVGGDGAAQTLLALGATGIRVVDAPVEGVPLGTLVGGTHDGLPVATKAGGFGDPHTLTQLIGAVRGAQGARS
ncbi:four-carbon acid sugar kinase family protein [Nocardioides eburneiflavus]|uniref:Four-carbon acid sugar kinase family protein n=1 Tax=Nocardioides eburneiflavus TaxID=2518372 RepID=A0A4Z1C8X7_9ACTN|nr:four-carbon acid sugar kinase family protein [Nocardioides eburneiflavus]TGN63656.1 four-carbon acid sugar kinase family protein [Nocardioides eburneiflavus]